MDPDRLDNLVGGRIACGYTVDETIRKEAWEEAGIPADLMKGVACASVVRVEYSVPEGLHREILFAHDLWLPEDFRPQNQDGEVARLYCLVDPGDHRGDPRRRVHARRGRGDRGRAAAQRRPRPGRPAVPRPRAPAQALMRGTLFPLAATLAVQLLVSMAVVTVPVLAPELAVATGVPVGYIGLFIALVYGSSMAVSLVSGTLVQRLGAIRLSQYCLAACAAGLACTATGVPVLLLAGAVLLGVGYGPVTPASSHVLAKTTPPGMMALVFSLKQTGVPLGGALAGRHRARAGAVGRMAGGRARGGRSRASRPSPPRSRCAPRSTPTAIRRGGSRPPASPARCATRWATRGCGASRSARSSSPRCSCASSPSSSRTSRRTSASRSSRRGSCSPPRRAGAWSPASPGAPSPIAGAVP